MTYQIHYCSILSAEFMRTSIHDAGNIDAVILSKAKARENLPTNGRDDEVSMICAFESHNHLPCFES